MRPAASADGPPSEVRAGAEHAVAVDDHAGVAVGQMLASERRHDGLVVDAGVSHQDAEGFEGVDGATLERGHGIGLFQGSIVIEIDAARIGNHGNEHAAFVFGKARQALDEGDTGFAQRFGVRHHVGLGNLDEVFRIKEPADLDHMGPSPSDAPRLPCRRAWPVLWRKVAWAASRFGCRSHLDRQA